jgi:hypothetical protein
MVRPSRLTKWPHFCASFPFQLLSFVKKREHAYEIAMRLCVSVSFFNFCKSLPIFMKFRMNVSIRGHRTVVLVSHSQQLIMADVRTCQVGATLVIINEGSQNDA